MTIVYFQSNTQNVKKLSRQWWAEFLTRLLGRSRLKHCCVGDGEVVYARRFDGSSFYPCLGFEAHASLFNIVCRVELPHQCDLSALPIDAKASIWRGLFTWASRGLIPGTDCVSVSRTILISSGLGVPRGTTTPDKLLAYLKGLGYEPVYFGTRVAAAG